MLLHDILKWLNLTATETTSGTLQLAPHAFNVITYEFNSNQPPQLISRIFYDDLISASKPAPQHILQMYSYLTAGIINRPTIELSCTVHAPHLPSNSLIIDMVRLGALKSYRLTIPGVTLTANIDNTVFETNIYALLNKEFGGNFHERLLVKPEGV